MKIYRRFWALPAVALLLAGCSEGPVAPAAESVDPGDGATEYLSCQVDLQGGDMSCSSPDHLLGDGALGAIIGGQGIFVELRSFNVGYDAGSETFSADVVVKNLTDQVLGSADGASPDPAGIRIFFAREPNATGGSGTITVANADGSADFNSTGQPYFSYAQSLAPGRTSLARTWEWSVPSTVTSFDFMVGVSAEVPNANRLAPGPKFITKPIDGDSLHTCALDFRGQAYCWGAGLNGRLGNGSDEAKLVPTAVDQGSTRFISIGAGHTHSCALDDSGTVYCWGDGATNRLGNGNTGNLATPAPIVGGHRFIQLEVGRTSSCGLKEDGSTWCWGENTNGQLGVGDTLPTNEINSVVGGHSFEMIAVGSFHVCGLTAEGQAYCWGSASNGKRGDDSVVKNSPTPNPVLGGHTFAAIYAGQQHTCGIKDGGEAWCWGSNGNTKLGIGEAVAQHEPVQVVTDVRFNSMSLAPHYTCGVALDGKGYCWGSDGRGKLGIGGAGSQGFPYPIDSEERFTWITAADDNGCGVTGSGAVYCWGSGATGRLGNGGLQNSSSPTLVPDLIGLAFSSDASAVCDAASSDSACFPRHSFMERVQLAARGAGLNKSNLI